MSKSRRMSVEDAELAILGSLAEGDKSFYDLVEREKIASPNTVLKALEKLENYGQVEKGEPEARKRVPYRLTVFGLVRAFGDPEVCFNESRVVEVYRGLFPLIFGKLEIFDKDTRFSIMSFFIGACREELGFIEFVMEDIDTDYRKEAEETIKEYPKNVAFYKRLFQGDELRELLEFIKKEKEDAERILSLSDEEYEEYRAARIKENKKDFEDAELNLVNNITKKTLLSFNRTDDKMVSSDLGPTYIKMIFEQNKEIMKHYTKDDELKEFVTECIIDEINRCKAYLGALKDLEEMWKRISGV